MEDSTKTKADNLQVFVTDIADAIRDTEGSTQDINPQNFSDRIRALEQDLERVGVLSYTSGRSDKIITRTNFSDSSSYPRVIPAYGNYSDGYFLFTNNSVYFIDSSTKEKILIKKNIVSKDTENRFEYESIEEVGDLFPYTSGNNHFIFYRVKKLTNGSGGQVPVYEIRGREINNLNNNNNNMGEYFTVVQSLTDVHNPFAINIGGYEYVCYCAEQEDQVQVIKLQEFMCINGTMKAEGESIVVIDGDTTNHPGSPAIVQLKDGGYLMVYETDIDANLGYDWEVRYCYSDNGLNWEKDTVLFQEKRATNNCPYIAIGDDGRVVISYHTTGEYFGTTDGALIHRQNFKVFISNYPIRKNQVLSLSDFSQIPTKTNITNVWTGGWGSLFKDDNGNVVPVYAWGEAEDNKGTIIDFVEEAASYVKRKTDVENGSWVYSVVKSEEDIQESVIQASTAVSNNTLVLRNWDGSIQASTPTNFDSTVGPTLVVTKKYVSDYTKEKFLSLDGGTLTGSLTVTGDLTIQGTTTIEAAQTLAVKDSIIIANADGAELGATFAGLAIRKDKTNTYGIMYDPSSDSVRLGLGTLKSDNTFTFANEGKDGNPIATRGQSETWSGGDIPIWDSTDNTFFSSGHTVNSFVDRINTKSRANEYLVYAVDESGLQTELTASPYVLGKTLALRDSNGCINVATPTDTNHATTKEYVDNNFVKKEAVSEGEQAYIAKAGGDASLKIASTVEANTIAKRSTNGVLYVGEPTANAHAATKQYVDTSIKTANIITITEGA